MSVLGADIEQLEGLAVACDATGTHCLDMASNVSRHTDAAIGDLVSRLATLVSMVTGETEAMSSKVRDMSTQAVDASWTGTNRETFLGAANNFQTAMQTAQSDTDGYYDQIKSYIDVDFRGKVEEFVTQLTTTMQNAQTSCSSMTSAVRNQASAVDTTMNTGLSLG